MRMREMVTSKQLLVAAGKETVLGFGRGVDETPKEHLNCKTRSKVLRGFHKLVAKGINVTDLICKSGEFLGCSSEQHPQLSAV